MRIVIHTRTIGRCRNTRGGHCQVLSLYQEGLRQWQHSNRWRMPQLGACTRRWVCDQMPTAIEWNGVELSSTEWWICRKEREFLINYYLLNPSQHKVEKEKKENSLFTMGICTLSPLICNVNYTLPHTRH